jgi:hypothetical protein
MICKSALQIFSSETLSETKKYSDIPFVITWNLLQREYGLSLKEKLYIQAVEDMIILQEKIWWRLVLMLQEVIPIIFVRGVMV